MLKKNVVNESYKINLGGRYNESHVKLFNKLC